MRKVQTFVVLIVAVTVLVGGKYGTAPPLAHSAAPAMSAACQELNNPIYDSGAPYQEMGISPRDLWAGETIVVEAIKGDSSATIIELLFDGTVVASRPFAGALVYVVPTSGNVSVRWRVDSDTVYWTVNCEAGAGTGCAEKIQLTKDAAVGRFLIDTRLYWTPGKLIVPPVTIPPNKTAWVLGVDESGSYYKIVWACDLLWVPVETMAPNYDEVWNGTPLPTSIVE